MSEDTTYGEAVKAIAKEDPDAAGLLAEIMEANARERESMLPSWADLDKAKQEAYWLGYDAGKSAEARRLRNRIFGDPEVDCPSCGASDISDHHTCLPRGY